MMLSIQNVTGSFNTTMTVNISESSTYSSPSTVATVNILDDQPNMNYSSYAFDKAPDINSSFVLSVLPAFRTLSDQCKTTGETPAGKPAYHHPGYPTIERAPNAIYTGTLFWKAKSMGHTYYCIGPSPIFDNIDPIFITEIGMCLNASSEDFSMKYENSYAVLECSSSIRFYSRTCESEEDSYTQIPISEAALCDILKIYMNMRNLKSISTKTLKLKCIVYGDKCVDYSEFPRCDEVFKFIGLENGVRRKFCIRNPSPSSLLCGRKIFKSGKPEGPKIYTAAPYTPAPYRMMGFYQEPSPESSTKVRNSLADAAGTFCFSLTTIAMGGALSSLGAGIVGMLVGGIIGSTATRMLTPFYRRFRKRQQILRERETYSSVSLEDTSI